MEAEHTVGLKRELLEALGKFHRNVGREDLRCHPRLIFALVVKNLVLRDDLPNGEGFLP
jgi:hypothetical protein